MSELLLSPETLEQAKKQLSTIGDWLRFCTSQLTQTGVYFGHGTDNAWDEAVSLVLPSLALPIDLPRDMIQTHLIDQEKDLLCDRLAARINERTPVAYLTNTAHFCGLPFYVDERVLVPRSPFAELITDRFSTFIEDDHAVHRILDMCTGSGCIAIALAQHFPEAVVDAADISFDALEIAEHNIYDYGLTERVFPIQSDVFSHLDGLKYDLIIANPPYVDAEDMADLPSEFHHEPELGLASGDDGLDVTRQILADASKHLTENGLLFVEVGNSMVHMDALYPEVPFTWLEFDNGGMGVFVISKQDLVKHF